MIQHLPLKRLVDQSNSPASRRQFRKLPLTVLFLTIFLPYAVCSAGTSKLYPPSKDEAGALRLAQVMQTATREEILKLTTQRQYLLDSGLRDSDFQDGSLAMGRVYCCHPSTDEGTAMWFYVPPDAPVKPGDIVVIRMGPSPLRRIRVPLTNSSKFAKRRKPPIRTVPGIHSTTNSGGGYSTATGCPPKVGR